MFHWLTILLAVAGFAGVLLFVVAALSLDWQRSHRRRTVKLLRYSPGSEPEDGLLVIPANGFEFRARVANLGGEGDAAILLHGFPQTSIAFSPLLEAGAQKYRMVAFDQRGYSPGARPDGTDGYSLDKLIDDVLAVADALGFERFHLVGHDWGAAVGWGLTMRNPERLLSWTALSVPHSYAFGEALRTDADQRSRSRYFVLFRTPGLAEAVLSVGRLKLLRRIMYRWMPAKHQEEYLQVFSEPGALTGALSWYRAVGLGGTGRFPGEISLPVLFIWGNRDPAVGRRAVELQAPYLQGVHRVVELDAGHWLLERRTQTVVDAVLSHWAENRTQAAQNT